MFASLLLVALAGASPAPDALPDAAPAHLGFVLREPHPEAVQTFLRDLQDPASPSYHHFVTPEQFGDRFGLTTEDYEAFARWLESSGFKVQRAPNRLFLEATGTVAQVRAALGVQLELLGDGSSQRVYQGELAIPDAFASRILHVSGLDTRRHLKRRITTSYGPALGADDLRLQYDLTSFVSAGTAGKGVSTAVLGTQQGTGNNGAPPFIAPSTQAIGAYFSTISHASATYNPIVMSNPNSDFDTDGSNSEYQLDVEMQSVGAPNADAINLVLSPSSEVFTTGVEYIVNNLSMVVAVSSSLGLCEYEEANFYGGGPTSSGSEMQAMQQATQQGVAEGQTWFAASGDQGSDDCEDTNSTSHRGYDGGDATVDFPASMPESMAMGGTQFAGTPSWDSSDALQAAAAETTWNEGNQGGGGGGGQSAYYPKPSWQQGVGPTASDGARDLPDLSLNSASSTPGTAVYDCGAGQYAGTRNNPGVCYGANTGTGPLDVYGGTSIASPLGAGFFALLASQKGCALGDVHAEVYALGAAQQSGGAMVFPDINTGNNTLDSIPGYSAGGGYDLATGWGTIDVAALVAAWPASACVVAITTGSSGSTSSSGTAGTSSSSSTSGTSGSSTSSSSTSTSTGGASSSTGTAGSSSGASSTSGASGSSGTNGGERASTAPSSGCGCSTHGAADPLWLFGLVVIGLGWKRRV